MPNYEYANNPTTTLSGSVTSGATAITVVSAALFPTQGKFTIIVDSEIMLVTGVAGNVFTVERGAEDTTAAAHNNNAAVTQILTKRSFLNAHHFDVRSYGAKGNGSTDDSAAVQSAITAAVAAGGGVVQFPPNATFPVTGLTVTGANVILRGSGPSTVLRFNGVAGAKLVHITADNCAIEDMTVLDNGVYANPLVSLNFNNTSFKREGQAARRLRVICTAATSRGISVGWSQSALVEDCYVSNTATTVTETSAWGIYIHSASTVGDTDDAVVRNNRVVGFYYGIASDGTGERNALLIDGNVVDDSKSVGIWGYHGKNSRIINNTVTNTSQGIFADTADVVSHNRVVSCTNIGIRLEQLQYGTVSDNTIESCGVAGIVVGGGTFHSSVSGNAVRSCDIGIVVDRNSTPVTNQVFELLISGNYIRHSVTHGIKVMGVYRSLTIEGNVITDNNTGLSATGSGIRIEKDSTAVKSQIIAIGHNTIGNDFPAPSGGGTAGNQRYGISATDDSAVDVFIQGNTFRGNVTAGIGNEGITLPRFKILANWMQATNAYTTPAINVETSNVT